MPATFDLYLVYGCGQPPDWDTLAQLYPPTATDGALRDRLCERKTGFVGLDLPDKQTAASMLRELRRYGANGRVVDAGYRSPRVSMEVARPIAEAAIQNHISTREPRVEYKPSTFVSENAQYWTFGAESPELVEKGMIPGAFFASVDKLDGHVWTSEEFEHVAVEREKMLGIIPGWPEA